MFFPIWDSGIIHTSHWFSKLVAGNCRDSGSLFNVDPGRRCGKAMRTVWGHGSNLTTERAPFRAVKFHD
ncbi:hypothetical protein DSCA_42950 [Desulfosarcina alkanivorans]|uniref:Uncharacterized protein n=1 Tax=Desulfosarcina alkanivorans TaxID=571177 RepID=A0A5K7YPT2_9BACT|nr:hypothetical protein DSCA_42950 [Desulfosarcina alkanivorans]